MGSIFAAVLLLGVSISALTGCGSGAGDGNLTTAGASRPTPGMATPIPTPTSDPTIPASRLADLTRGGSWDYLTFPSEDDHGNLQPRQIPSGHKYVALVPAGSSLAAAAGQGGRDTDIPGALIRLSGTADGNASSPTIYHYDGTYRQDTATGDLYLLRLSTGQRLDWPAKVLPGTWGRDTEVRSQFVVDGDVIAYYSLTVDSPDVIDTFVGRKPVWLTRISINWHGPRGKAHLLTSKQWFEPAIGTHLKATSRDARMVLEDLTWVEILDDEILSAYKVNP
ncbi:MAG: hypothetical protein V4671_22880 [Armatimonadota bacterium]